MTFVQRKGPSGPPNTDQSSGVKPFQNHDWSTAPDFDFSVTTNWNVEAIDSNAAVTFSVSPENGETINLLLITDVVGNYAITWPSNVYWVGGTPTPAGPNVRIRVVGIYDGSDYWLSWVPGYST